MNILIRQEKTADYPAVSDLIKQAFAKIEFSDHKEQHLVNRLRKSDGFIPELSLVAIAEETIVGHILLTTIQLVQQNMDTAILALAPVSVHPSFQNQGIGSELIKQAHSIAKTLQYKAIVLIGHADYYPRFGYQQLHTFGIEMPFPVPKENAMVLELEANFLSSKKGRIVYPSSFFEA